MKHPILYRVIMYTILSILCGLVLFMLSLMNSAPFKSSDMRNAFFHGCNAGHTLAITHKSIMRCKRIAEEFKVTLDDLDRQINNE